MTQASENKQISASAAAKIQIDEASEGQRIDNFLTKILKGVPKPHIYRILRSGEVRVNKGRVDASYKLMLNDIVRIPPIRTSQQSKSTVAISNKSKFDQAIIYEDQSLLVINKPAGFAVHGGSGVSRGVIEQLREERPTAKFLELVHRLDRDTSGVLLLAKKRTALVALHEAIKANKTDKRYTILVAGEWTEAKKRVVMNLQKYVLPSGERRVNVVTDKQQDKHNEAQISETIFYLKQSFEGFTLLEAKLVTGRTHQLRVQLAHLGFPIVGDDKYGDFDLNKKLQKKGLKRMFLHSSETKFQHPMTEERLRLVAPLPTALENFLQSLTKK
ncbi:MAG TPA: RluA family pseudouridine synthase [Methylophilaceae bacterium]|nr:RluA family pseudouridine synthase [Methylophilaceae bacterium]